MDFIKKSLLAMQWACSLLTVTELLFFSHTMKNTQNIFQKLYPNDTMTYSTHSISKLLNFTKNFQTVYTFQYFLTSNITNSIVFPPLFFLRHYRNLGYLEAPGVTIVELFSRYLLVIGS